MSLSSIKTHYSLIPLFAVFGVAMGIVVTYIYRLGALTTDINWSKRQEPFDYYKDRQFKFISTNAKPGSDAVCQAPNYKED